MTPSEQTRDNDKALGERQRLEVLLALIRAELLDGQHMNLE